MENKKKNGDLRLGRIGKKMEEMLGIRETVDTGLYVSEASLNALTKRYPEQYLAFLEALSFAIRHVKTAEYLATKDAIALLSRYRKGRNNDCRLLFLHQGKPKRWYIAKVHFLRKDGKRN